MTGAPDRWCNAGIWLPKSPCLPQQKRPIYDLAVFLGIFAKVVDVEDVSMFSERIWVRFLLVNQ